MHIILAPDYQAARKHARIENIPLDRMVYPHTAHDIDRIPDYEFGKAIVVELPGWERHLHAGLIRLAVDERIERGERKRLMYAARSGWTDTPEWEFDANDKSRTWTDAERGQLKAWARAHDLNPARIARVAVHRTSRNRIVVATLYQIYADGTRVRVSGETATSVVTRPLIEEPPLLPMGQ